MRRIVCGLSVALILLTLLSSAIIAAPAPPQADRTEQVTTDGLTMLSAGSAVYYGPSWDNGGWDQIVQRHIAWGHAGPDFVYRTDGNWCVHPDYNFGSILTLRNANTGATIQCTVGDAVAPQDQANWRRHTVIELAYKAFTQLGLQNGNSVEVYYLPNG